MLQPSVLCKQVVFIDRALYQSWSVVEDVCFCTRTKGSASWVVLCVAFLAWALWPDLGSIWAVPYLFHFVITNFTVLLRTSWSWTHLICQFRAPVRSKICHWDLPRSETFIAQTYNHRWTQMDVKLIQVYLFFFLQYLVWALENPNPSPSLDH